MFENCVFKVSVDTKRWMKKAGIRAVKTVAQTAVATIGTATALGQVDAKLVVSASILSGPALPDYRNVTQRANNRPLTYYIVCATSHRKE